MFKKIFALFARYSPEEVQESELAQERGRQAQETARQRELQRQEGGQPEEVEIPVEFPETTTPNVEQSDDDHNDLPKAA